MREKRRNNPSPVVFLQGERLFLRPIEKEDLPRCQRWINDPAIRQYGFPPVFLDAIAEDRWHEAQDRRSFPSDMVFAITLKEKNRHIGNIGLHNINWIRRSAVTGTIIGEGRDRDRGFGHEAKSLLLAFAFNELGLHRIESHVRITNERSLAYLDRCGYKREGVMRDAHFFDGQWVDVILLSILEHEWRATQKQSSARTKTR